MDKAYCLKHQAGNARDHFKKHHTNIKFEPVNITADGKSQTIKCQYYKNSVANFCCYDSTYGATGVAEPCCVAQRGRYAEDGSIEQHFEPRHDGKTNTITNVQKDNAVAEPVRVGTLPQKDGSVSDSKQYRVYSTDGKSTTLCGEGGGLGAKTGLYALRCPCYASPCEFDESGKPTKAISCSDGKTYVVYEVKNEQITINGKQYQINLADGFWIIRKLTVRECARLQTIPEWFIFPVSDTQAFRQIGNGWTVSAISHMLNYTKEG